jgi:hypothetical protein
VVAERELAKRAVDVPVESISLKGILHALNLLIQNYIEGLKDRETPKVELKLRLIR